MKTLPKEEMSRVLRMRFELRSLAGTQRAYVPYLRLKRRLRGLDRRPGWDAKIVDAATDLVVDSLPRSGNTFALAALHIAENPPTVVGHHACVPAQVMEAVRLGIPTIVIVRDPRSTVLSQLQWNGYPAQQWLRSYVRYYERVGAIRSGFVIARFEEITTDFGQVVERVNKMFNTSFGPFEHTPENVQRCYDLIEANDLQRFGAVDESQVSRPSADRSGQKEQLSALFDQPRLEPLRHRAQRAYEVLAARASS